MNFIIKSSGESEAYDSRKLERSLSEAFKMTKSPAGQAEHFTKYVLTEFQKWIQDKPEITSSDVNRQVAKILDNIDPSTAYIFKNFKSII
jgi:transcriptional regulator NrdR family protein